MTALPFEPLVAEDSILRRLPLVVDRATRLRIDALAYSADAISNNWHALKLGALAAGADAGELNHYQRASILSAAWAIVDELDAVRQLVQGFIPPRSEPGPIVAALLTACEPVRSLRNKLRHLSGNLNNFASSKGRRSALFGSLSWVWCPDPLSGVVHIVTIQSGMLHGDEIMTMANPAGRAFSPPVDLFQLDAFGMVLELSVPILALAHWLKRQEADWVRQLNEQIVALAAAMGKEEGELLAHSGGSFAISMEVHLTETPSDAGSDEKSRAPEERT